MRPTLAAAAAALALVAQTARAQQPQHLCALDTDCAPLTKKLTTNERKTGRYLCVDSICKYTVTAAQLCNVPQDCAAYVFLSRELVHGIPPRSVGPDNPAAWLADVCSPQACDIEAECSDGPHDLLNSTRITTRTQKKCCRGLQKSWTCVNLGDGLNPCEPETTCDLKDAFQEELKNLRNRTAIDKSTRSIRQCVKSTEKKGIWIGIVLTLIGSLFINLGLNLQRYALIRVERKKFNRAHGLQSHEGSPIKNAWARFKNKKSAASASNDTVNQKPSNDGFENVELHAVDSLTQHPAAHAVTRKEFAAHNYNAEEVLQRKFGVGLLLRNKFWLFGFSVFALGNVFHFVALKYAPQSVIGPVASFSLVVNVFMAPWINNESLQKRDLVGVFFIVVGGILVALFSGHAGKDYTLCVLILLMARTETVVYLSIVSAMIIGLYLAITIIEKNLALTPATKTPKSPRWDNALLRAIRQTKRSISRAYASALTLSSCKIPIDSSLVKWFLPFAYAALGGLTASLTVLFAKATANLVNATFVDKINQFTEFSSWAIVGVTVFTAVSQIYWINRGLQRYDALLQIPAFHTVWILFDVIGGGIYYHEFTGFTPLQASMFALGIATIFVGVFVLAKRLQKIH